MKTDLENVVVLSINEYHRLLRDKETLIEQNQAISKGLRIHIDYGSWLGFNKSYEILNASESEKKLLNKIMDLEKNNLDNIAKVKALKSMSILQFIKSKFKNKV